MNDKKIMSVLIAMFLAISALTAVSGDGSDPNDPTDGGADWDGDGSVPYTHLRAH